jgi:hypothetical protein
MGKPNPVDATDDQHSPKRKFKCSHKNPFRIIGTEFDDAAKVHLEDPQGVATWVNPPLVSLIQKKVELKVDATCTCGHSAFLGFLLRLFWPLLRLFRLVSHNHYGIGSLTITVTNDSGDQGVLTIPDITYE